MREKPLEPPELRYSPKFMPVYRHTENTIYLTEGTELAIVRALMHEMAHWSQIMYLSPEEITQCYTICNNICEDYYALNLEPIPIEDAPLIERLAEECADIWENDPNRMRFPSIDKSKVRWAKY